MVTFFFGSDSTKKVVTVVMDKVHINDLRCFLHCVYDHQTCRKRSSRLMDDLTVFFVEERGDIISSRAREKFNEL